MQSIITSKYQTTIPKVIHENPGLSVKDALEWKVEKGKVTLYPGMSFMSDRILIIGSCPPFLGRGVVNG